MRSWSNALLALSLAATIVFGTSVQATPESDSPLATRSRITLPGPAARQHETNAERFARGLPPLTPRKAFTPTRVQPRQAQASPVPNICDIGYFHLRFTSADGLVDFYLNPDGQPAYFEDAACFNTQGTNYDLTPGLTRILSHTGYPVGGLTYHPFTAVVAPDGQTNWGPTAPNPDKGTLASYLGLLDEAPGKFYSYCWFDNNDDQGLSPPTLWWTDASHTTYPLTPYYTSEGMFLTLLGPQSVPAGQILTITRTLSQFA